MNFQLNTSKHSNTPSPIHNRYNSTSTDTSSIADLLDNVLTEIEQHETKHQTKLFPNPYNKHSSIDDTTLDNTPTLPLSTTKEAIETQIAFITHAKHKQPEISLEPINNGNINNYYFHTNKQQTKYKLFSPNPFYPGQSLPILVQIHQQPPLPSSIPSLQSSISNNSYHNHTTPSAHRLSIQSNVIPLQHIIEDPMHKLEKILRERDEDNNGLLDMEEFIEALHEIDKCANNNDLQHIFELLTNNNNNKYEISIHIFMKYIRNQKKQTVTSPSEVISPTPKTLFRSAFPDIFGDINDVENREIWGDAQMTSIDKLEMELQEEAEHEGIIDFPEFEAAINNMGIQFNKQQLKNLFAHFIGEQDIYHKKIGIKIRRYNTHEKDIISDVNKKYELKLGFLMDYLKQKVDNHKHLQPKQILKLAFMDLLLNEKLLNKQSSFLDIKQDTNTKFNIIIDDIDDEYDDIKVDENKEINDINNDTDDSFIENLDFDNDIAAHAYETGDNDNITLSNHLSSNAIGGGSLTKGDRQLMRMGSTQHWTDKEVEKQTEEMENQLKIMQQQNSEDLTRIIRENNINMYNVVPPQQETTYGYY